MKTDNFLCSTNYINKWVKEAELYEDIVNFLWKHKEDIKYIETKLINDTTYHYFQYKDKEIDVSHYSWQNSNEYNLTVGDVWFCTYSHTQSEAYKKICKYLHDKGIKKVCELNRKKEKEREQESIKRLKKLLVELKND